MMELDENAKAAEQLLNSPDDTRVPTRVLARVILNKLGIPHHFLRLPSEALCLDGKPGETTRLFSEPFDEHDTRIHVSNENVTVGRLKEIAADWINNSVGLTVRHLGGTDEAIIGWQLADRDGRVLDAETNPFGLWSHEVMRGEAVAESLGQFDIAGDCRMTAVLEGDVESPEFVESVGVSMKLK